MKRHFTQRGLAYFILALFLISWVGQLFAEAAVWLDDAHDHGLIGPESVWDAFRNADFWEQFWQSTLENWQSEWLQVATFVLATAYLVYTGSAESADSDQRIEAKIDALCEATGLDPKEIEKKLPEKYQQ